MCSKQKFYFQNDIPSFDIIFVVKSLTEKAYSQVFIWTNLNAFDKKILAEKFYLKCKMYQCKNNHCEYPHFDQFHVFQIEF